MITRSKRTRLSVFGQTVAAAFAICSLIGSVSAEDTVAGAVSNQDFTKRIYINGGLGLTRVEPESPSDALSISDNTDSGGHLAIGYDLNRLLTVEGYVATLGEAQVDFLGDTVGSVDYLVFGASLLGYLVNSRSGFVFGDSDVDGLFRREGLSLYGRLGIGHIENDADRVEYFRDHPNHVAYGLGLEYGFANGLALRTEIMAFDTDARYFNVGLVKRFGDVASVATVAPVAAVVKAPDAETSPAAALPEGPVMFKPVVPPFIYFEFDKSEISDEDRDRLDTFVAAMQDKDMTIMIEGHTDWIAPEAYNMSLSVRRAEAVFNYLASKGIAREKMTTMGYGENRPISNNNTSEGRALNRRSEIQLR